MLSLQEVPACVSGRLRVHISLAIVRPVAVGQGLVVPLLSLVEQMNGGMNGRHRFITGASYINRKHLSNL